jgi:membrane-associated phospholipid phosphatase
MSWWLTIWNIISLSEVGVLMAPIVLYLQNYNIRHIIAFAGIITTACITEGLKIIVFPKWHRPNGAFGCDLLTIAGSAEGRPGFPSGHSSMISFFGAYYGLLGNSSFLLYVGLIAASRYYKRCHTISQILGGLGLGIAIGLGLRCAVTNMRPFKA